jgi:hypothetical protein
MHQLSKADREKLVVMVNRNGIAPVMQVILDVCDRKEYVVECARQLLTENDRPGRTGT